MSWHSCYSVTHFCDPTVGVSKGKWVVVVCYTISSAQGLWLKRFCSCNVVTPALHSFAVYLNKMEKIFHYIASLPHFNPAGLCTNPQKRRIHLQIQSHPLLVDPCLKQLNKLDAYFYCYQSVFWCRNKPQPCIIPTVQLTASSPKPSV